MFILALTCAIISTSTCSFADEKDDQIAALKAQVADLESQVADLQSQLDDALSKFPASTNKEEYKIGDTWIVEGQWKLAINSVEETQERNEYSDYNPAAVYLITYTYENIGYEDDIMDGLYIDFYDGIVDSTGKMGYSYPGDITLYPQETPVGASCEAQACIGVDNPGNFKINYSEYDSNYEKHTALFNIEVE